MVAKSARFLAPIALVAVATGAYLIVSSGLAGHPAARPRSSPAIIASHTGRRARRQARFYVVKAGDTLSAISVKTHIPILQLTTLNPSVSPNSLQTGQRLRLRR